MNRISRRRLMQYGLGAATAVAVAARAVGRRELRSPRVLRSHRGKLKLRLVCRPATVDMHAAKPVRTWTYDGIVPGYTWELRGGEVLAVDLRNRLPMLPAHPSTNRASSMNRRRAKCANPESLNKSAGAEYQSPAVVPGQTRCAVAT